jgi:hypothetical protein
MAQSAATGNSDLFSMNGEDFVSTILDASGDSFEDLLRGDAEGGEDPEVSYEAAMFSAHMNGNGQYDEEEDEEEDDGEDGEDEDGEGDGEGAAGTNSKNGQHFLSLEDGDLSLEETDIDAPQVGSGSAAGTAGTGAGAGAGVTASAAAAGGASGTPGSSQSNTHLSASSPPTRQGSDKEKQHRGLTSQTRADELPLSPPTKMHVQDASIVTRSVMVDTAIEDKAMMVVVKEDMNAHASSGAAANAILKTRQLAK